MKELWCVADALNMSRLEVFAMNSADDIDMYTRTPQGSWFNQQRSRTPAALKQCSDAVLPSALLWGHNEDAGMDIDMPDASTAYIVNLTNSNTGLRYLAYTYPGQLSGNAWSFNSLGVVSTTNAQFPKDVAVDGGIPRNFINRRVLDAANVTQALQWSQVPLPTPPVSPLLFVLRDAAAGPFHRQRLFQQPGLVAPNHILQRVCRSSAAPMIVAPDPLAANRPAKRAAR